MTPRMHNLCINYVYLLIGSELEPVLHSLGNVADFLTESERPLGKESVESNSAVGL